MTVTNYNNNKIELLATNAVKDCLLMTDTLRPFINENDKTPSWDGEVFMYKSNRPNKEDILGTIKVQVKGSMSDNIKRKECSFRVAMSDLVNYKNDGGTIYFVVLINKNNPTKKRVFYETLTPLKITTYINGHDAQESRAIKLKKLPVDKYAIQTIFYNFYQHSFKQHSFSNIPPISFKELSSRRDIAKITFDLTIFSPKNKRPSPTEVFFKNDVYWYAEIANSPILHPIEWRSEMEVILENGFLPIFVNGERYDNYISLKQTKRDETFQFGKSTTLIFTEKGKRATLNYKPSGMLSDRIKDFKFVISLIETGKIDFGENRKAHVVEMVADKPFDIAYAKKELESYKRIEQFWKSLHVVNDFDIGNIDSNSSLDELYLLMKSINGKQPIHVDIDGEHSGYLLHKSISNFKILFFIDRVDKEKSLYKIYNYFDYMRELKITRGDTEHISSQYSALSPDDYCELSNMDISKMLQSYKDLVDLSDNIFEPANYDLLNLLLAYDKHLAHPIEMLNVAKEIAYWILTESSDKISPEIRTINYLQTLKRERELTAEENIKLYEIAENEKTSLMFKLGANLLLENYKVAGIQFEKLCKQDKELFRSFPIYTFWK